MRVSVSPNQIRVLRSFVQCFGMFELGDKNDCFMISYSMVDFFVGNGVNQGYIDREASWFDLFKISTVTWFAS